MFCAITVNLPGAMRRNHSYIYINKRCKKSGLLKTNILKLIGRNKSNAEIFLHKNLRSYNYILKDLWRGSYCLNVNLA